MKRYLTLVVAFVFSLTLEAQELYVFTEPASNMPAYSVSAKASSLFTKKGGTLRQRYIPELMLGVSKKLMVHAAGSFSDMHAQGLRWDGAYLYSKYRFYSHDEVHAHFRMAFFGEVAYSRNPPAYEEINLQGDVSGLQGGLIATQLINKMAFSATASYLHVLKTSDRHQHTSLVSKGLNYSLSAGYLVLPVEYRNYEQLNLNVYAELLGQQILGSDKYSLDAAPAIQLIFHSNTKLNLGYRFQLSSNARRNMRESFLVSLEHTFFNALKRKKR